MKEVHGHRVYTVQDLIHELSMFEPNHVIGLNVGTLVGSMGLSIMDLKKDPNHDIVDINLQQSYSPILQKIVKGKFSAEQEATPEEF